MHPSQILQLTWKCGLGNLTACTGNTKLSGSNHCFKNEIYINDHNWFSSGQWVTLPPYGIQHLQKSHLCPCHPDGERRWKLVIGKQTIKRSHIKHINYIGLKKNIMRQPVSSYCICFVTTIQFHPVSFSGLFGQRRIHVQVPELVKVAGLFISQLFYCWKGSKC